MKMIATHNSATGERGKGILSFLVAPFSKCQSKTIREQFDAGCRYFDIRVKQKKYGWICAHGLWKSKKSANEILSEINDFEEPCYVMLTYEGRENFLFNPFVEMVRAKYGNIKFTAVNVKKPVWKNICNYENVRVDGHFKNLDGRSWHTYLPIPWLWKRLYYDKVDFNDEYFKMVDFL